MNMQISGRQSAILIQFEQERGKIPTMERVMPRHTDTETEEFNYWNPPSVPKHCPITTSEPIEAETNRNQMPGFAWVSAAKALSCLDCFSPPSPNNGTCPGLQSIVGCRRQSLAPKMAAPISMSYVIGRRLHAGKKRGDGRSNVTPE